ncbi:hypothetical protein HMPREF1579_01059 [Gardnerella vaginalis JCP8066]|nr:hypothetical protein HMPREF1579_01059 [Gardnerella vaginalis JCP8066]
MFLWLVAFVFPTSLSAFCTCFRSNLVQSALITQNSSYELILNCIKQLVKYALHSYMDFAVWLAY